MHTYKKTFGRCAPKTDPVTGRTVEVCSQTALEQGLVSVTLLFIALGGLTSGPVGSYLGRRGTIQVGAAWAAIGAAGMLGTAGNFTAYLACKCIGGIGLGHIIAAAPVWGAECTIASKRGILLALYSVGAGVGNAAQAAVCWGSSKYTDSNLAWQIPIICQIPLSCILGFGVFLFPESPRWLLTKDRDEAAKKAFAWFYAKESNHSEVLLQVQDVQRHIEMERLTAATTKWTEIYHGVNFRRTAVSGLIMTGLAITGSKFTGPYGAIFLAQAGIKNPFLNNFILATCTMAGTVPGPFAIEYGGRRFSQLVGYTLMMTWMLIIAIVGSVLGQQSDVAKRVLLGFLFSWAFMFGCFIGTTVWVGAPEQHTIRLRTYGQASTTTVYQVTYNPGVPLQAAHLTSSQIFGFAATFYGPYMISKDYGNMGLTVGYFYAGMHLPPKADLFWCLPRETAVTFIMLVLTFLFVPETARLSLEQIDDYYMSGRQAWKTSLGRNKRIAKGEISEESHPEETLEKSAE